MAASRGGGSLLQQQVSAALGWRQFSLPVQKGKSLVLLIHVQSLGGLPPVLQLCAGHHQDRVPQVGLCPGPFSVPR